MTVAQQAQIYSSSSEKVFLEERSSIVQTRGRPLVLIQDTIGVSAMEKTDKVAFTEGPKLPPPYLDPKDPAFDPANALDDFTKAFCAIFTSIANDTNSQTQMLDQLQALDQTQSQIVVASSNAAITAEETASALEGQIADQEAAAAKMQADLGWMQYLGMAMGVLAIVLSIPTGGASDVALAEESGEEVEMAGAPLYGEGGLQAEADSIEDEAVEASGDASAAGRSTADYAKRGGWFDGQTYDGGVKGWFERRYEDLKAFNTARAGGEAARDSMYMKLFNFVGGACSALPMLLDGVANIEISKCKFQLGAIQRQVAPLLGVVNENQLNFQFFQQLNRRQTTVVQTEGDELADVLTLAGSIMKGYQQIPSQLVNPA